MIRQEQFKLRLTAAARAGLVAAERGFVVGGIYYIAHHVSSDSDVDLAPASPEGNVGNSAMSTPTGMFQDLFPGANLAPDVAIGESVTAWIDHGQVDVLSTEFAIGWASVNLDGSYAHVIATLGNRVLGASRADISREDLEQAKVVHAIDGRAFAIAYHEPISLAEVERVAVRRVETAQALARGSTSRIENRAPLRIFVLGSPRSGTSQLGATLASCLSLAWAGEAHVGPRFAAAAEQLSGDPTSPTEFVRALAEWDVRRFVIEAARRGYFYLHSSSSFVDKTPGVAMVRASPFMAECFPDAKFIFIRRHPVANIVSRLAKFGGDFEEHCSDWSATMNEWLRIRPTLPNYLELEQEEMAAAPGDVAMKLSEFLKQPELYESLSKSLSSGYLERTGAGGNSTSLSQTNWTEEEKSKFKSICDVIMRTFNYDFR